MANKNLPCEILNNIFLLCNRRDLVNLTLTCKYFNEIISNSSELMRIFCIYINHNKSKINKWNGTRKYQQLCVDNMHFELPIIIDSIQNNLTKLMINLESINGKFLKDILVKSRRLKVLMLKNVNVIFRDTEFQEPLPRLDLDSFSCGCNKMILRIMRFCQVKRYLQLLHYKKDVSSDETKAIQIFLKNQNNLEKLDMNIFFQTSTPFDSDTLDKVAFRLRHFKTAPLPQIDIQHFLNFLKNHRKSLESFDLDTPGTGSIDMNIYTNQVLSCMSEFPNLKNLKVKLIKGGFKSMPFVEKLYLFPGSNFIHTSWGNRFPNLKELELRHCDNPAEISKLKKLEKLDVFGGSNFVNIELPSSLKSIKFYGIHFKSDQNPIDFGSHQLESFFVDECRDAAWIVDFLKNIEGKLKIIDIQDTFLSSSCRFTKYFKKQPELKIKAEKFICKDYCGEISDIEESYNIDEGDDDISESSSDDSFEEQEKNAKRWKID